MSRVVATENKRRLRSAARDMATAKEDLNLAMADLESSSCVGHLEDVLQRLEFVRTAVEVTRADLQQR